VQTAREQRKANHARAFCREICVGNVHCQAGRQAGRHGGRVLTVGQAQGKKEGTAAAFFGLLPSRKSKQASRQAWSSPPIITGSTNSASHIVHHHSPHVLPTFSQMLQSFP